MAALAQLRALPALAGDVARGILAPESVAEWGASMRDHAAPIATPPRPARPASAGALATLAGFLRISFWGLMYSSIDGGGGEEAWLHKSGGRSGWGGHGQWRAGVTCPRCGQWRRHTVARHLDMTEAEAAAGCVRGRPGGGF